MLEDLIEQAATSVKRRFPMVERDDIRQEMWVWALEHQDKVEEFAEKGKVGVRQLFVALARCGTAYGQGEKARIIGYHIEDVYYYTSGQLRELLPDALDMDAWTGSGSPDHEVQVKPQTDPAHGNNRLAMLCDVKASFLAGSEADKTLLWTLYGERVPEEQYAQALGIEHGALKMRVVRAIQRLQKRLGGPPLPTEPVGGRKALSNASAQALTRNQEDPHGE